MKGFSYAGLHQRMQGLELPVLLKTMAVSYTHLDVYKRQSVHDGVGLRGRKFYRRGRGQPGVRTDRRGNAARQMCIRDRCYDDSDLSVRKGESN